MSNDWSLLREMNRRLSDSLDNKPFNRLSSPPNQWQSKSGSQVTNQFNPTTDNPQLRPFGPNPYTSFGSYFGNQRFFTPRSSYFGPQNDLVFTSAANMNQNLNYGQNYANYDYNPTPSRPHPSYNVMDSNRPVYSTDLSNISLETEDINQLKKALMNANREKTESKAEKSTSPESTVSSTPNTMDVLIAEMKKLTDRENQIKKTRRDVEKKITDLDEELRDYEKKIEFREKLKKIKSDFERDEEELALKRQKVVSDMEKVNKLPDLLIKDLNTDLNASPAVDILEKEENSSKRVEIPTNNTSIPKPTLKRANTSTMKPDMNKKVRISSTVSHSSGVSTQIAVQSPINTTPKVSTKASIRRTPIPTKNPTFPKPNSNPNPGIDSPKVNRICRQQTPNPITNSLTSGVRTSRPQKMMSSRTKRNETIGQTSEPSTTTAIAPKMVKPPENTSNLAQKNSETDSIEPESDNEVLKELEKISLRIDSNSSEQRSDTFNRNPLPIVENLIVSEKNVNEIQRHLPETDNSIDDIVFNVNKDENSSNSENNVTNVEKNFELIDMTDSGDEECFASQQQSKEQMVQIKTETPDSTESGALATDQLEQITEEANNLLTEESQKALRLHPRTSSKSSDCSDTSEDTAKDSPFKVPTEPGSNKKHYKFCGFDAIPYEPTVVYSISSFKAIAGPKSKTASTSVIFLKSFKDYLFASFMDSSVRRFHIENKNVLKYEGHERLVLTLIIIECPKNAGTFILYTGGKDKKLRAFNAITGQILNSIELSDEITCIIFNWSHIFCALNDGNICKVSAIHEIEEQITDNSNKVKSFVVNANKKIMAIVAVKAVDANSDVEAVIALSFNKLRIVNTIDSISDEQRILESISVHFSAPIFMRTFENICIISFKCPPVKNEDKNKKEDKSRILMFDLQKNLKDAIKVIDVNGIITSLDLCQKDLIVSCFSGKIQCIDCEKRELKWIVYGSRVTASVKIGDRLVLGNDKGIIDVIYLDQTFMDCETCGVTFARQIDFKQHIQLEHKPSVSSDEEQINKLLP